MKRTPIQRRTRLKRVSSKRTKENRIRRKMTKEMTDANTPCAIRSPHCDGIALAYHEALFRSAGGAIVPGETADRQGQRFIPACHRCNEFASNNHKWAIEKGFKVSRYANKSS